MTYNNAVLVPLLASVSLFMADVGCLKILSELATARTRQEPGIDAGAIHFTCVLCVRQV